MQKNKGLWHTMVDIMIQGAQGRMGKVLATLIQDRQDCRVVAGIDIQGQNAASLPFPVFANLEQATVHADVLIDFSHPDATAAVLPACAQKKMPCVVCTTGLNNDIQQLMREAAKETAVFYSANMSLGINLLAQLVQRAQQVLDGFDIEIVERHHHYKLDAPSGTALLLADAINEQANGRYHYVYDRHAYRQERDKDEIGIHAVRAGSIVGDHEVLFAGPDETITLAHSASSRDVFATGAIAASLFLAGKPAGMYSMKNLLGDI